MGRVLVSRIPRIEYMFVNGRTVTRYVTNGVIEQYRCNGELIQLPSSDYTILDHVIFGERWSRCAKEYLLWTREDITSFPRSGGQITILPSYECTLLVETTWICPDGSSKKVNQLIKLKPQKMGIEWIPEPFAYVRFDANFMTKRMDGCVMDRLYVEQQYPLGAKP